MANRTVSVELQAKVSDYVAGVKTAEQATGKLNAELDDIGQHGKDFAEAEKSAAGLTAATKTASTATGDLADEVDKAGTQMKETAVDAAGLAHEADKAGTQMRQSAVDAKFLAEELQKARTAALEAAAAFTLTGEKADLREYKKAARYVTDLERLLKDAGGGGGGGSAAATAESAGTQVGQSLFKGMEQEFKQLGGLREIITNPYVLAALAPALVEVGVMAGGALLAGIGLAGVGAGIAGQLKTPEVAAAVASLKAEVAAGFTSATDSFAAPLVHAIGVARGEWQKFAPGLTSTFEKLSPLVGDLTEGIAGFADEVVPAIEQAAVAAAPLVQNLAQELPSIGAELAGVFDTLARNADTFNDGLKLTLGTLKLLIGAADWTTQVFSTLFKVGEYTTGTIDAIKELGTSSGKTSTHLDIMADSAKQAAAAQQALETALGGASTAFERQINDLLASDRTAINYQQSVDDLTTSVRQNGATLDITTQKGRNNKRMLDNLVGSIEANYEANIKAGKGADAAGLAFAQQVGDLKKQLTQLGFSGQAIDEYIAKLDAMRLAAIKANAAIRDTGTGYTHHDYAIGGFVSGAAADGMFLPPRDPGTILAGEPQTGGEWLIPQQGISQARAAGLLAGAAAPHGLMVSRPVSGSVSGSAGGVLRIVLSGADAATQALVGGLRAHIQGSYGGNVQLALGQ